MDFHTPRARRSEEPVLPLVNIVFLLLIFFMLAGSLAAQDPVPAEPPRSSVEAQLSDRDLVIVLGADGALAVDGAAAARAELSPALEAALRDRPDRAVWLKADANADSLDVIVLLEALQDTGLERVQLVTRMRDEPPVVSGGAPQGEGATP